jgi:NTP pyrophosphatase (non-canonical NTP hydrolase)
MELDDYVKWTENTCAKLETKQEDIFHMLFGITTEVGELTDIFKKALAYGKVIDWINVDEELGDLMFYIASFCRINNISLNNIINKNVAKLEGRYPEKFSEYRALNRDLEKEREILEK